MEHMHREKLDFELQKLKLEKVQENPVPSHVKCKIEKVPRGIRGEKSSKDMASSRNLVSTI